MGAPEIIKPQEGPQEAFLSSSADIVFYGGAAGGGKSWALLLEPIRHIANSDFGAVIFRRTSPEITNEGGLWDESEKLYPLLGATPRVHVNEWEFPEGAKVKFAHMQHEKDKYKWQGSQIPFIGFDEITHFSKSQFFYMLSRNRSMCGIKPYIRGTCNPDCDSWIAEFISWWINPDTGLAITERSGIIRYFINVSDKIIWGDSKEELMKEYGNDVLPKSFTFIPATLADNQKLMEADPGYLANLKALPAVEQARLLGGNWKIRHGGSFFSEGPLLVNGKPVPVIEHCDYIFCVIDSAIKTGAQHDSTAVSYWQVSKAFKEKLGYEMVCLDWDVRQIRGSELITWLPDVHRRMEELARIGKARMGYLPPFIEDKASGTILLQQCQDQELRAEPIEGKLTAMGKDERALYIAKIIHEGRVKISEYAYNKVVTHKEVTKNHFLSSVLNYILGEENQIDDAFDTFCYAVALALGSADAFDK